MTCMGIESKRVDTFFKKRKDTYTSMFVASLFTIAKIEKQPTCLPTNEWLKKMWYIYTMEYYSSI